MVRVAAAVLGPGFLLASSLALVPVSTARADVVVSVSKSEQKLAVWIDGKERYRWPVSTGRRGLETPSGTFHPIRFERKWYSRQYHWSPMPYSIFFHGGYALHGTSERSHLGRPASHGCVRMLPANAAILFNLVRKSDRGDAYIVVSNDRLPAFSPTMWKAVPLPERRPRLEKDIIVPLPGEYKPQFDLPGQTVSEADAAYRALAAADDFDSPILPTRASVARYEAARDAAALVAPVSHREPAVRKGERFVSVGDDAAVLRGRDAWLRSLDRQYGITR